MRVQISTMNEFSINASCVTGCIFVCCPAVLSPRLRTVWLCLVAVLAVFGPSSWCQLVVSSLVWCRLVRRCCCWSSLLLIVAVICESYAVGYEGTEKECTPEELTLSWWKCCDFVKENNM